MIELRISIKQKNINEIEIPTENGGSIRPEYLIGEQISIENVERVFFEEGEDFLVKLKSGDDLIISNVFFLGFKVKAEEEFKLAISSSAIESFRMQKNKGHTKFYVYITLKPEVKIENLGDHLIDYEYLPKELHNEQ